MGIGFYVWTVDRPEEARRVLELGAEGVITNRLDLLASLPR
jgi:glycerophosphoryl diester phosphodiesterase